MSLQTEPVVAPRVTTGPLGDSAKNAAVSASGAGHDPSSSAAPRVRHPSVALPGRTLRESPYPALLGKGLLAAAHVQVALWDRALRRFEVEQQAALQAICQARARHRVRPAARLRRIKSYDDYARRVPVGDYDSFSPFIDRMRKGEQNLLVPEFVRYFGNSSGSSQQGKREVPADHRAPDQLTRSARAPTRSCATWSTSAKTPFTNGFTLGLFPPSRCGRRAQSSSRRTRR